VKWQLFAGNARLIGKNQLIANINAQIVCKKMSQDNSVEKNNVQEIISFSHVLLINAIRNKQLNW